MSKKTPLPQPVPQPPAPPTEPEVPKDDFPEHNIPTIEKIEREDENKEDE